jgi:hypothetical protein
MEGKPHLSYIYNIYIYMYIHVYNVHRYGYRYIDQSAQQRERLRRDAARQHGVLQQRAAGEAPLHEPPHVCVLIHVDVAQASIPKHHRIFAPSVLLESMQKPEVRHVFGVMHQAGMCVWRDHLVEGVSSVAHISCVPAAHQAACPSPS